MINAREDVEKREPSYTVGGNVKCYSHYGEQYGDSLKKKKKKKLRINLPHDPATLVLGIYPEETIIKKHMYLNVHRSTIYNSQDM